MTLAFAEPLRQVVDCLDDLAIPFFVVGSVASVVHGEIRTTQDVDIVVELEPRQVAPLVLCLQGAFFVDERAVAEAVTRRSSCNVIHRATAFKVDLFLRRDRDFSREEILRRQRVDVAGIDLPVATSEDCVLSKLEWFEKGGQVSDRQWRDVLGVLKARGEAIDFDYARRWAGELGLPELLERALREAGLAP